MPPSRKQSGLGIASIVVFVLAIITIYVAGGISPKTKGAFSNGSPELTLVYAGFIIDVIGFFLGIAGLFRSERRKGCAIAGSLLTCPMPAFAIFLLLGHLYP